MIIPLRVTAWLLAAAVAFATLGPASERPGSSLGHLAEHGLAFLPLGIAFSLAYPRERRAVAAVMAAMTAVLEILQLFVPGRHARVEDFTVDFVAAMAGFVLVAAVDRLRFKHRSRI